ncbi:hypothetical protein R5R35_007991 [Gryllus longicercus]|uniref:Origin recognition complex subunit 3 n=1 Tax=Gryllus longicercus TaxID=2509291 RepID=A0AAN9V7A8_9ORTH
MAATVSVSKGCFVFNKNKVSKRKTGKKTVKQELLCDDPWYLAYKESWTWVEEKFESLHHETFSSVLKDLVSFVENTYKDENVEREISTVPTAALLTGINMPDHGALFSTLCDLLHKHVSPYIATLHAHKCKTIRHTVEQMTSQFMNAPTDDEGDSFSEESDDEKPIKVKKSQCNMLVLESWYQEHQPNIVNICENGEKTKSIELKEGGFSETSPIRKHLTNEITQNEESRSPRKQLQFSCDDRKEAETEGGNELHFQKCLEIFNERIDSEHSNTCTNTVKLNQEAVLLHRTPVKQELRVQKAEDSPRLRRTPRKLTLQDCEVTKSPKISSNENLSVTGTPKDRRVRELQNNELRRSPRSPKPILRLVEESSEDSDDSTNVSSKRRKMTPRKINYSKSTKMPRLTNAKELQKCPLSPKVILKRIDNNYQIINSINSDRVTELGNKDIRTTPRKVAELIEELRDKKSPSAEQWICEVDLDALAAKNKIPKIILRQLHDLKVKLSPQRSPVKGSPLLEVKKETQCTPRKMSNQTPVKKSKDTEMEENKNKITSTENCLLSASFPPYRDNSQRKKLIVIIPEFEKFPSKILQDFILILRSSIPTLPIVLIMGIATSVAAVHRSLPYRMSACLSIKPFQSPPSVQLLNSVLEQILFSSEFPFRLGNKTFCFLMDAFLYYDLSVKGFVQAIKFCMMEHFCGQNWKELCCKLDSLREKKINSKDLPSMRSLPSMLRYMDNLEEEDKQKLMNDDQHLHKTILKLLNHLLKKVHLFHIGLKCLNIMVADLPKKPLGTHVRELYGMAASSPITRTAEYKECFQILKFLSRDELIMKLNTIISILDINKEEPQVSSLVEIFRDYRKKIQEAGMEVVGSQNSPTKMLVPEGKMSRQAFKEKLLQLSKKNQPQSQFEKMREEFVDYLSSKVFPEMLKPPASYPLMEIIMFDNTASVKTHIVGAPRAAIHTALNDPQFYLECTCCQQTEKDSILASMPDLCIAYKLYQECGRLINLYDWLQAFSAIVDPQDEEEDEDKQQEIKPQIQARFTRAVAELQFMGFLKTSSRKIDHVTKLYFDGGF